MPAHDYQGLISGAIVSDSQGGSGGECASSGARLLARIVARPIGRPHLAWAVDIVAPPSVPVRLPPRCVCWYVSPVLTSRPPTCSGMRCCCGACAVAGRRVARNLCLRICDDLSPCAGSLDTAGCSALGLGAWLEYKSCCRSYELFDYLPTDAVLDEVRESQNRPLDPVCPVVFFDALRVKICDERSYAADWSAPMAPLIR
jgi:hypothetical protein